MATTLPFVPSLSPVDGLRFRALVGATLPLLRDQGVTWASHVEDELQGAVACGSPEDGFLWLSCDACDVHRVVAVSCKGRGFCPRCGGRRMAQGAMRLVEDVLPQVPVRQWVLSLPIKARLALAWRPWLVSRALGVMIRALEGYYRQRTGGGSGYVTVIQRFGSSLSLNIHVHVLALDGGYVEDGDAVRFVASPSPGRSTLASLVRTMGRRVERLLRREEEDEEVEDGQLSLWSATGRDLPEDGSRRGAGARPERRYEASYGYYSLDASRRVVAEDRDGLERLCRYVLRPAVSLGRLGEDAEGRVVVTLRHPWRDGTEALRYTPEEFVGRLAALVPPKGQHLVRYHGVLAPASRLRRRVVLRPRAKGARARWIRWSELVERTLGVEVLRCPCCRGRMRERALVRSGAAQVWVWLSRHATRLLFGPPGRAGPGLGGCG